MDRLNLELLACCGLGLGEVLEIKSPGVIDRKVLLREPKSGKENSAAFMPEQRAKRLAGYATVNNCGSDDRMSPNLSFSGIR
jgi:integrase/recombinase XerD